MPTSVAGGFEVDVKTQGEPPITVRTWAKVLVFGGVTAAVLIVVLGVILPFLVLDPPHGLGIHPFLADNPGSTPGKDDTYGRIVAGLLAWLGGTYVGIRMAGIHGRRERRLAALSLAGSGSPPVRGQWPAARCCSGTGSRAAPGAERTVDGGRANAVALVRGRQAPAERRPERRCEPPMSARRIRCRRDGRVRHLRLSQRRTNRADHPSPGGRDHRGLRPHRCR